MTVKQQAINLPLCNDTIRRRIDEIAIDLQSQLNDILRNIKLSLALEGRSFHIAKPYFWVIPGSSTIQHLSRNAFLHVIENNHYSDDVVKHNFTENGIPITNLISVSADGTPAMMGKHNEVLKLLRNGN